MSARILFLNPTHVPSLQAAASPPHPLPPIDATSCTNDAADAALLPAPCSCCCNSSAFLQLLRLPATPPPSCLLLLPPLPKMRESSTIHD